MGFPRGRAPGPARVRGSVFAVGRLVYVACGGDRSGRVMLTDEAGKKPLASVGDGTEVAIVAWRPGWAGTTQYRVRATDSDLEGWLGVANLRSTAAAVSEAPVTPLPPAARPTPPFRVEESRGRFDPRSPLPPGPIRPVRPETSSAPLPPRDDGNSRRKFGQRSDW